MARYDSECGVCGQRYEYHRTIQKRFDTPVCCGKPTRKMIFSAPQGFVKGRFEPFKSVVDGSIITTQREMNEHNKRNNVVSLADGYDDATIKRGDYAKPPPKDEAKQEVIEAYQMVKQGYKPKVEVPNELDI